jgi:DNA-binding NtrC family response regulator
MVEARVMADPGSSACRMILVVEDEVMVRALISEELRDQGCTVIEAANVDEWLRAQRPNIDVILTGNVTRAVNAAAELCESGALPKPYEPQIAVDRIKRLMTLRAARKKD